MLFVAAPKQCGGNALSHHVPDDDIQTLIRVPDEDVEIAVDSLRGNCQHGHSKSRNISGRLVEQQGLLDFETDLDFALTGLFEFLVRCLELRGSGNDALLQLGIQRSNFLLRPLTLGNILDRAESFDSVAVLVEFYLRPFPNPSQITANDNAVLNVISCPTQRSRPCFSSRVP